MGFGALDALAIRGYELSIERLRSWHEGRGAATARKEQG
jgi:hypothetical protein